MNHMKNIKEILSIPTGNKLNVSTSGYSSFTDSQVFFGSQFWPENSQGMSQDMSVSSRASQQSSEGSDPKFSSSYHTKPFLFGELKDKSKGFGILDKFEEDRKRAKEKADGVILAKECTDFRETLNNIRPLVAGTERNIAVCQTVLEKFDNFASALQNCFSSLQGDISKQFETLLNKVNSQKEMMTELEKKVQKSGDTTAELDSNLQSLKTSLECLREEQERERNMLEEALKLLSTLVSEHSAKPNAKSGTDSAIQTSPRLEQPLSNTLQDSKLESTTRTRNSYNLEHSQAAAALQYPDFFTGKRKSASRGLRRRKKRPLVLPQRSKRTVTDENRQPLMNKQLSVSTPLCKRRDPNMVTNQDSCNQDCLILPNTEVRSKAEGRFITPLSCWSQDSNSSACLSGVEPILEKLSESKRGSPVKPEGLWQLFEVDSDSGF